MPRSNRELWIAFIAIAFSTLMYLVVLILSKEIPAASDFYGHSMGILGFVLMLVTETVYSLRKRRRSARWGRMSTWLQFHIFTGLVGPYLVLLHSSWKFNGLAGIAMLLTLVIVVSGFVGRYIYTAVPRGIDGAEIETGLLEREIHKAKEELSRWLVGRPESIQALARRMAKSPVGGSSGILVLFSRSLIDFVSRVRWWWVRMKIDPAGRESARQLEMLLQCRSALQRQLGLLVLARQSLGLWRVIHIPIGISLFVAAFIHMVAAVYYATLLR
jgi:hypothetical protein